MVKTTVRWLGWLLVAAGATVLLYLGYEVFYTSTTTERAQAELLESWELEVGDPTITLPGTAPQVRDEAPRPAREDGETLDPGDAYAVMRFERPGSDRVPVHADPLFIVEGVDMDVLRRGPGHYPTSDAPGGAGNFAISGHRTTYGAPFYHLDDLVAGDRIHVVDRDQREWTYRVVEQRIVAPTDVWVVGDDPLGNGQPMLTLTTCHPRFRATQRLVVFAELVTA